jgi:hypothetical protein
MIGRWVMMKQRWDGARVKRNLWQAARWDMLHVARGQLHATPRDWPCGRGAADRMMGPRTHRQMWPSAHWDCIWRHGNRCADRNLDGKKTHPHENSNIICAIVDSRKDRYTRYSLPYKFQNLSSCLTPCTPVNTRLTMQTYKIKHCSIS